MGALEGKRGLVMGVANERSIAWGIAKACAEAGAELAFTYQGEAFGKRLEPLAQSVGSDVMLDVDVTDDASLDAAFSALQSRWDTLDFVIHAIAYSDKSELTGRILDTSRDNFKNSMDISAYSLIEVARRAHPMMVDNGGTILTLSYMGSNRVTPNYNVMGVAKAALEAGVRYLANDLGPEGIRVNAISPGPMKTLAGSAIGGARQTFKHTDANAPLRSNATEPLKMEIRRTDLSEPQVIALLHLHHSEMVASSPPGTCHVLDLSGLTVPEVTVFAAWNSDQLLSIGALKAHDGFAEIKSMRAHPDARGTGAGRAMLTHLIDAARDQGFETVKLETGSGPVFEAALALYRAFGFEPCAPFAGYTPGEFNQLFALRI